MNKNIEIEKTSFTTGISYSSFIALNRYIDRQIFKDSKLFTLLTYIAIRVKRDSKINRDRFLSVKLNVGEFIIGRLTTVQNIDITEAEYKNRFLKLQKMEIINVLKRTNQYTLCKWLENEFIDLNIEYDSSQQNDQQNSSQLTTNNNTNNLSSFINLFISKYLSNKNTGTKEQYGYVVKEYMNCKGITLKGKEIMDCLFVIRNMFESQRSQERIVEFMKWLKEYENYEGYPWIRSWTINTVQKKLPEFLAGKLKIRKMEDDYEYS